MSLALDSETLDMDQGNSPNAPANLPLPGRYLCFRVGNSHYAIPLLALREVIAPTPPTVMPQMPAHCKGVINLRGRVVSIIDLAAKLKTSPVDHEPAVLIIDIGGIQVGLQVSAVDEVAEFSESDLSPPPSAKVGAIYGIAKREDRMVLILDPASIAPRSEIMELKNAPQTAA
jgi:purine-binding chemotaxis protein CheW